MNTLTDQQLLRDYAASRSEPAFRELVRRHLDLVHSAALRIVRNSHTAEDVTQAVFTALAKDARRVAAHPVLAGWLHRTTRHLSANTIRADVRRRSREQQAIAMNEASAATDPDPSWDEIAPHLDAVLGELSETDRDAVILRYFEKRSAKEIATTLGITAEAAQKRVNRAVERLRESFARRGVTAGGVVITTVINSHAVQAAPADLATTITAGALAGSATTPIFAMNTLQKWLAPALALVLAGTWVHQNQKAAGLRAEVTPVLMELAGHRGARDHRQNAIATPVRIGRDGTANDEAPEAEFAVAAGVWDGEWHGHDPDPELTSLDNLGRPTTDAVEKLGLTDEEAAAVTAAVQRVREEATADFVARVKLISHGAGNDGSYHYTYQALARPDRGQQFFDSLAASFADAVGADRAKRLRSCMNEDDFLGGMGKYDLEFDFTRTAEGGMSVKYGSRKSGDQKEIERTISGGMDSFEMRFGQIFEFPDGGTPYPKIPIRSLPGSR